MTRLRIKIPIEPVPKGRPRVTMTNSGVRTYTPERTMIAEEEIRTHLYKHRDKSFPEYLPIKLSITFYRRKSKWKPKNNTEYDKILPVRKPDIDNLAKMVLDAMNKLLFVDDAQITTLILRKKWAANGNHNAEGYILIDMEQDGE